MGQPLVSIIIPVYNVEKYLAKTINSAIEQTWPNKEIILINDGSNDNSLAVANQFKNEWIKVYDQQNKGAGLTRNAGLAYANGDFIQYLDGDDLLSPTKIEDQISALLHHPNNIAVCSTIHFQNEDNLTELKPNPYEEKFLFDTTEPGEFLINLWGGNDNQGSMIQTNAWLIPIAVAQKAGKWPEFYSSDDDGEYFSRVILASEGIRYVKNCYNYYRKNSTGLANRNSYEALMGVYQTTLLKQKTLLEHTNNQQAKFAIARTLIELAIESYPAYPLLTKEIVESVKKLGDYNFTPISGGPITEKLSMILGWKLARRFQVLSSKLRK